LDRHLEKILLCFSYPFVRLQKKITDEYTYYENNQIYKEYRLEIPVFIAIGSSLLTGLIGLLVGNRLAIGRDRRNEFNSLAEPIRKLLLREKERLNPYSPIPDKIDLLLLRERLPFWKRKRFDQALFNYQKSKNEKNIIRDRYGSVSYKDQFLVVHSIDTLLKIKKHINRSISVFSL
jgi:hypothetical protein